jgi:hypothetical protein
VERTVSVTIRVDGPEPLDDAQRDQLAADLEDFLVQSGTKLSELHRETSDPTTSALGELLVIALPFIEPTIKAFSEVLATWLESRRMSITITMPDGRNISVSGPHADHIARALMSETE